MRYSAYLSDFCSIDGKHYFGCQVYSNQNKWRFSLYVEPVTGYSWQAYQSFAQAWHESQKLFKLLLEGCAIEEIDLDFCPF